MKFNFKIELAIVKDKVEECFEDEDALREYLEKKEYDAFKVHDYVFISDNQELLIFKPNTRGSHELIRTYGDYSWYEVADFLGYKYNVEEDICPSDIVEVNIKSIQAEVVQ